MTKLCRVVVPGNVGKLMENFINSSDFDFFIDEIKKITCKVNCEFKDKKICARIEKSLWYVEIRFEEFFVDLNNIEIITKETNKFIDALNQAYKEKEVGNGMVLKLNHISVNDLNNEINKCK